MKFIVSILIILGVSSASSAQEMDGILRVAWLQGCWELLSPDTTIEEQWMAPRGNNMVGISRTVQDDTLAAYEIVVIRELGDGLVFEAHPSGQPSASFLSVSVRDSAIVFENMDHDFPRRIGYQVCSPDSLNAWIEGNIGSEERRIDFPYRRVDCAGE